MKMRLIKMFMLPVAVFMLASAAAVGTDKSHKSSTEVTMDVYLHNPDEEDCLKVENVDCQIGEGAECSVGPWQAFGLTSVGCSEKLERI